MIYWKANLRSAIGFTLTICSFVAGAIGTMLIFQTFGAVVGILCAPIALFLAAFVLNCLYDWI